MQIKNNLVDANFSVVDFECDVSVHVAHQGLVVSGLAFGIDINSGHSHLEALQV